LLFEPIGTVNEKLRNIPNIKRSWWGICERGSVFDWFYDWQLWNTCRQFIIFSKHRIFSFYFFVYSGTGCRYEGFLFRMGNTGYIITTTQAI